MLYPFYAHAAQTDATDDSDDSGAVVACAFYDGMIAADSPEQARQIADAIAARVFPAELGYLPPRAFLIDVNAIVTPDTARPHED